MIWLAVTPLAASRFHTIPYVGLLLGPPLVVLSCLALVAGFVVLFTAVLYGPLAASSALGLHGCLAACEWLVDGGNRPRVGYLYVGDIPEWWLWVFYLVVLAGLTHPSLRRYWRWGAMGGLGWLSVGLLGAAARPPADELRCTFLAVGHGGCAVLEMPDGRTILYDTGAMSGPEVTRRQIVPFLLSRGLHRIDEVFLSHADLDHFNGLVSLVGHFVVGQITCTRTFTEKPSDGVQYTLAILHQRRIPLRFVKAGDRLTAGEVTLDVLHPPATGIGDNENARSLVLEIRHAGHTLLLAGDLEGAGLERVLRMPRRRIDVLQAPHHGSRRANTPDLAAWARPRVVISCQGPPRGPAGASEPYSARGARFLGTWPHGAITVRSHASGLVVETYVTGERMVVR
jgi:competence protein ComEC